MNQEIVAIIIVAFQMLLTAIGTVVMFLLRAFNSRLKSIEEKVTAQNGRVGRLETWREEHLKAETEWRTEHSKGEAVWREEHGKGSDAWRDQHIKLEDERHERSVGHYEKLWLEFKSLLDVKSILQTFMQGDRK